MAPKLEIHESENYLTVELQEPRLTMANVAALGEVILPRLADMGTLLLDLSTVTFIDSSGLGFLVRLKRSLAPPQQCVLLGITHPGLLELLQMTRMDQVFLLTESAQTARKQLNLR